MQGTCLGVGVATLIAPGVCGQGICMDGRCCWGCCSNGVEVSLSLLLGFLVLLTSQLEQLTVSQKGLVGSWDWFWSKIQSLASWYCMAWCRTMILSISWVWEWGNLHWVTKLVMEVDRAWIPSLEICQMLEEFILKMPAMLPKLDSSTDSIKGKAWASSDSLG